MTRETPPNTTTKEAVMDYQDALEMIDPDTEWCGDDATLTCPDGCTIEIDCPACSCGHTNPIMAAGLI